MIRCTTCNLPALVTPVYGQRGDVRVTVGIVVSCSGCGSVACKGDVGEAIRSRVARAQEGRAA